jgi:hypothetical protein
MAIIQVASSQYAISLLGTNFNSSGWSGGSGKNRFMIVVTGCIRQGASTTVPTAATFDGDSMTKQYGISNSPLDVAVFTLANPSSGTGTLVVTVPNTREAAWAVGAVYANVDTDDAIHVKDQGNLTSTAFGTNLQVTTTLPGRTLVAAAAFQDGTTSASAISPATERREVSSGSSTTIDGGAWIGDYAPNTTGSYTASILLTSSEKLAGGMFALNPAPDGAAAIITGL